MTTAVETAVREPVSTLERVLRAGKFAVTAEIVPPRVPSLGVVTKKVEMLRSIADGINITDNASAAVKMSSLAVCTAIVQQKAEPVLQITCRDRNRLAIQADVIGGYALGIRNIFVVSGDYITMGDHPAAKPVYDMDSVQVLQMLARMKEGFLESGIELRSTSKTPLFQPDFFLGAAANPFGDPLPFHVLKTGKKLRVGAQFIQTQCTFDVPRLREFMRLAVDRGLTEQAYFLIGIMPVKSHRPLEFMLETVPGMRVPTEAIARMKAAENGEEEGARMAVEIIEQVREIPGVAGIHLMTVSWEAVIPEILKRAKLLPEDRGTVELMNAPKPAPAAKAAAPAG